MAQCLQRCGSVCLRGHLFMAIFHLEWAKKTDPTKSPKMWQFFCFCGNLGGSIFLDQQKWKTETHYQLETLFGYKTSVPIIVTWALVGNTHSKQCQVITSDDGNINRFWFSTVVLRWPKMICFRESVIKVNGKCLKTCNLAWSTGFPFRPSMVLSPRMMNWTKLAKKIIETEFPSYGALSHLSQCTFLDKEKLKKKNKTLSVATLSSLKALSIAWKIDFVSGLPWEKHSGLISGAKPLNSHYGVSSDSHT